MRMLVFAIVLAAVLGASGVLGPGDDGFGFMASGASDSQPDAVGDPLEDPTNEPTREALAADESDAAMSANPSPLDRDSNAAIPRGAEPEDAPEPPASPSTFYQWIDERGSVHFAASLDEVPASWRARAGQVELESAAFVRTRAATTKPARRRSVVEEPTRNRNHDVTVYTAPWCGWCRKTLAFLDDLEVDYEQKDIEENPAWEDELRAKSGGTSIPYVEIDDHTIRGYSPGQMATLLR